MEIVKKNLYWIIVIVVIAGGMFFSGMKYGENRIASNPQKLFANNKQAFQKTGNANGGGMTAGEIIAKDDKSVTIKTQDNSSKIIFYSASAEIGKFASGTNSDLEIGKSITISGKTNSDGSITAQSIQIRPKTQTPVNNQ